MDSAQNRGTENPPPLFASLGVSTFANDEADDSSFGGLSATALEERGSREIRA